MGPAPVRGPPGGTRSSRAKVAPPDTDRGRTVEAVGSMHPSPRNLTFALVVLACAVTASAGDLTSASFRMRAAHESSIGARVLASPGPRFLASGAALGEGDAIGFAGG